MIKAYALWLSVTICHKHLVARCCLEEFNSSVLRRDHQATALIENQSPACSRPHSMSTSL